MKNILKIFSCLLLSSVTSFGQQKQQDQYYGTATGTNSYTASITPISETSPYKNQTITIYPGNTNTGASTLVVKGSGSIVYGAVAIVDQNGSALVAGDLVAGQPYILKYSSSLTKWVMIKGGTSGTPLVRGVNTYTAATAINTGADLTINTGTSDVHINCDDNDERMTGTLSEIIDGGATYSRTVNGSTGNIVELTKGAIMRGAGYDGEGQTFVEQITAAGGGSYSYPGGWSIDVPNTIYNISVGAGNYSMTVTPSTGHTEIHSDEIVVMDCDDEMRITSPATTLSGVIKISGGNPGIDKVLRSDVEGLASWTGIVMYDTMVTIDSVHIKSGASYTVVPGKGANTYLRTMSGSFFFTTGTNPFTTSRLYLGTLGASGQMYSRNGVLDNLSNDYGIFYPIDPTFSTGNELIANTPLVIDFDGASATGNGSLKIHLCYMIIRNP